MNSFFYLFSYELFFLFNLLIGILVGMMVFSFYRKHLLMTLLSMELVMLFFFFLLMWLCMYLYFCSFIALVFLTFVVCEGSISLALLVMLIRSHGHDFFSSMNLVMC